MSRVRVRVRIGLELGGAHPACGENKLAQVYDRLSSAFGQHAGSPQAAFSARVRPKLRPASANPPLGPHYCWHPGHTGLGLDMASDQLQPSPSRSSLVRVSSP